MMRSLPLLLIILLAGCSGPSSQQKPAAVSKDPPRTTIRSSMQADTVAAAPDTIAAPRLVDVDTLLDDYACFLAGIQPRKYYLRLAAIPAWREHAARCARDWTTVQENKIRRIRRWSTTHPVLARAPRTLFYPFAGADFLFADAYFPACDTIIMVGLEPVGSILELHAMRDETCASFLAKLNASMAYVNRTGYFITKKMRSALYREDLNGTLPLIMFYIKRCGFQLAGVDPVTLDSTGAPVPRGQGLGRMYSGVRIRFTDSSRVERRTLYYFSFNLSSSAARSHAAFYRFAGRSGPFAVFLKAASYLMHDKASFSAIRNLLLDRAAVILQDDSGIPYKSFDPARWTVELHGSYSRVLPIFRGNFQPDMALAYRNRTTKRTLPFRIGYNTAVGETNLQVAARK